ncbi:MAG: bifunctional phosphopantothenoylcysteine decarboxylase/phosphopantothenate--cysteine ligase CoaBC [Candidatus Desulforudis sp.]|nr:bifunctional phosphopantothenoylcysteine decarboxylase/phosphopantothenate--cysteine ligase CoaBC [Desulforudis sp.]
MLGGKTVILGVTGSIAAYRAADVAGQLVRHGAEVHVIMTRAAREFISPLTMESISGNPVRTEMFAGHSGAMVHLDLARSGDVVVVAPATANVIGKVAGGVADDLLTTLVLAFAGPVLLCPAMNPAMYANPIVQRNIRELQELGYRFCGPEAGRVACGDEGRGRLAPPESIVERVIGLTKGVDDLRGVRVMVTAGATREPLDPVRYLTNRSSGRMGYAVARAARDRGADVVLVSGPTSLPDPDGLTLVPVETASEMFEAVRHRLPESDILVMAAAVADYRPAEVARKKIKKQDGRLTVELEPTADILAYAGRHKKPGRVMVGFAAETGDPVEYAMEKARKKGADLMVGNDVTRPGAGFDVETNLVVFVFPDGRCIRLPQMDKYEVAWRVLDEVLTIRGGVAGA